MKMSEVSCSRVRNGTRRVLPACLRQAGALLLAAGLCTATSRAAGPLRIEVTTAYNFVVDSNVETPATYAPRSAYLGATYYNDGIEAFTNVYAYIGDYDGGTNPTPGIYPSRSHPGLIGPLPGDEFALTHEGGSLGTSDATRYLGTIEPGESKTAYWLVSYPNLDEDGKSVALGVKPDDDLWLYFDVWGKAYEGPALLEADVRRQVFMRNMLSAMANKISPNGANKVPQEYLDLLQQYEPSWTNNLVDGSPGSAIVTEGIWYDLGNINQGFDNDGDLIPDYNAWMQPVGDPSIFDAGCFRLVKTFAMVVIKRSAGDVVILAEDQLYFTNLPEDNNGAVGYVRYEFMPLCSGASATLSPYQAVASGNENEKFNGDFGATLGGGLVTQPSSLAMDKQVDLAVAGAGSNLNYTVAFTNTGAAVIGNPDVGLPVVISDSIPAGSTYVGGSAAAGNTLPSGVTEYTILYSTNNAVSWSVAEPSPATNVTHIQWWLSDPLQPGASGIVTFSVTVKTSPPPLIHNVAGLGLGTTTPFLEDDASTTITGVRLISGTVFADIGTGGGGYGNGIKDGTEAGISNVTVTLYYDANTNGVLDAGDVSYAATFSATNGAYAFTNLPAGDYIVVVDDGDADIPQGYALTTVGTRAVTIVAANVTGQNFGFAPGLILTKTGPALLEKGGQAAYTIAVSNSLPATSETISYTVWATNYVAALENAEGPFTNPNNALGVTNGTLATHSFQNKDRYLGVGAFPLASSAATITNVRVVVAYDTSTGSSTWRAADGYYVSVYTNVNAAAAIFTSAKYLPATMDGANGGVGTTTNDITASLSWKWTYFNPANSNLFVRIEAERQGGGRSVVLGIDAIGMLVTTDAQPGVLETVPLYDYYDTNVLQYASSVPNISSSDTNGPAPNTGRLVWNNVGPLSPGASTNVSVTFNVIGPPGNAGMITTNQAAVTNATYSTGGTANEAFDEAVSEVPATASIGDTIFWDANLSGSQDASEEGVVGVTVELYTNGVLVASTVTGANGFYLFEGLTPDTYTVLVVTNGGVGYPLNGASISAHPDNDGVPIGDPLATVSNNFTTVTVVGGQDYRGADFGYVPPGATIGGVLWIDFNDDGIPNSGESTIAFIPVTLYDGSGNPVATNVTDADGNYLFYGLSNGTYNVVVATNDAAFPSGLVQTVDPDAALDSVATNMVIAGFTIDTIGGGTWTAGDLEVNFGYRYEGNNSLSGTVGMDDPDDIDGVLNGLNPSGVGLNETAFAGTTVYVYLWNDNSNGVVNSGETILLGTTVTDANGDYSFTNLPDGGSNDYFIVSLVAPYNFLSLTTTTNDTPATLLVETENAQGHTVSAYQVVPIAPAITNMDFAFVSLVDYDFGDLPDTYRTLLADNGPRHIVNTNSPTLYLGSAVDTENNGLPSVGADGDDLDGVDDEDGVFAAGIWQNGTSNATVRVQIGAGSGWLVGFIDFDNSGAFDNANELVVSQAVSTNVNGGLYEFTFNVLAGSLSTTNSTPFYSRWRLLPSQPFLPALAFQGEASNGEVEDYRWLFHVIAGSVLVDDGGTPNDFDGADSPQAGVVVNLYTNGTLVASTVTEFDGSYSLYGVPDGAYRVTMDVPTNATAILDADGVGNTFTNIAVTLAGASVYERDFLLSSTPTRVTLMSFDAVVRDAVVVACWETMSESGTVGFHLERLADGIWTPVGGFVPAAGGGRYEQADSAAPLIGTLTYRLVEIENTGRVNTYGPFRVLLNGAQTLSQWLEASLGVGADAEADADGDGMSNRAEFLAGTDANDGASALRFVEIRADAQGVTLRWNSEDGRVYTIERAAAPGAPAEIAAGNVLATPPVNEIVLPLEPGAGTYRVKLK
jgi:uncharacterized repeat protein (TIGR01451 family)